MHGFSRLEWLPARVPGHVHTDLVQNGVIADPVENLHELGARWVDAEDWVYRCEFEFVFDAQRPHTSLRFEGLDTVASVYLNGIQVGEHDNMFVPCELDVSATLVPGANVLEVHFAAAERIGRERRRRYFESEGLRDDIVHFDERAFVRKAQYMFGWDWGPRLVSAGVWGRVELVSYRARFCDVHVVQQHLADGAVELVLHSEVEGEGELVHTIDGIPGRFRDGERIRIEQPLRWWPRGLGAQHRYVITSSLQAKLDGAVLDRRETRVGLRTLRLLRQQDDFGESFEFECNGRLIFCGGANWIPDSSFPAAVSRERVRAKLAEAAELNMNMLRVWGGGLYESDDFYEACDELGLLVWQDFPYACSYYPDGPEAQQVARDEASEAVRRLRNRACLAIWCGNNENLTMFQDKWTDAARHPPRYYGENIYERTLRDVLTELDPERPYIPTSPWGGTRANEGGSGDQHYWDVWHGRGDWKHYQDSTARFSSEFGFAAAPGRAALRRMASNSHAPLELALRDRRARWHDKTRKGYETFIGYVELHYPKSRTLEDWLYYSQLNQRDALRHAIEHYRRSHFCRGSLIWQLNDCWPAQSWAVIDSENELKGAAFELQRLYAPALVSLEKLDQKLRVWVVLDNALGPLHGELCIEARSLVDGRALFERALLVTVGVGERKVVLELDTARFDAPSTLIYASLLGSSTFRLLAEPKQSEFSAPKLVACIDGSELVVETDLPVVDLYLWDDAGEATLCSNFITLSSGGSCRIRMRGVPQRLRARSLAGEHSFASLREL